MGSMSECHEGGRAGWQGMGMGGGGARPAGPVTITGTRIAHNSMNSAKGTQATQTLKQTNATTWAFDFCASAPNVVATSTALVTRLRCRLLGGGRCVQATSWSSLRSQSSACT